MCERKGGSNILWCCVEEKGRIEKGGYEESGKFLFYDFFILRENLVVSNSE